MISREQLTAQADEWLARKDEIRERFSEGFVDPKVDAAIGMSLVGTGLGVTVANLVRGKRSPWAYVVPAALFAIGLAIMSGGFLTRRAGRISSAEEIVRAQLAELDPIARAQVLRDAASQTFGPLMHHSSN